MFGSGGGGVSVAKEKSGMRENKVTGNIGKRENQDQFTCSDQNTILFEKNYNPLLDNSDGKNDSLKLSLPIELRFASRNKKEQIKSFFSRTTSPTQS